MMVSAANGAKLISNSVVPSPMATYFIVIFPYPLSAPVTGASRFIVIDATLWQSLYVTACKVRASCTPVQHNRDLGHYVERLPRRFCKFRRQIIRDSDRVVAVDLSLATRTADYAAGPAKGLEYIGAIGVLETDR